MFSFFPSFFNYVVNMKYSQKPPWLKKLSGGLSFSYSWFQEKYNLVWKIYDNHFTKLMNAHSIIKISLEWVLISYFIWSLIIHWAMWFQSHIQMCFFSVWVAWVPKTIHITKLLQIFFPSILNEIVYEYLKTKVFQETQIFFLKYI